MDISASEWHPMAVHFPLALVITGTFALSASCIRELTGYSKALATVGTWNLCLGAIGSLFALGTGLAAVVSIHVEPEARATLTLHVKWAIFTSMALLLLAVWRGAGNAQDARPSRVFLAVLWTVTAALIVTGYWGGQNVYRHGVGVERGAVVRAHAVSPKTRGEKESQAMKSNEP